MPFAGDVVDAIDVEIANVVLGTVAWVSATGNGTTTSGTTETRDAVMGNLSFVVAAAQAGVRYRIVMAGRGVSGSVVGDRFTINFRDGGSSTPTATSPLVGVNFNIHVDDTSSNGVQANFLGSTFIPGPGTHTIGVFYIRTFGTGTGTPTGASEFYAEALGVI